MTIHAESYAKGFAAGQFDGERSEDLRACGRSAWASYGDGYAAGWRYGEAKAKRAALDAELTRLGAPLKGFPRGPMGLTPDAVRRAPEYLAAKSAFDAAFQRLRHFNGVFTKTFATEIRAERSARRATREQADARRG